MKYQHLRSIGILLLGLMLSIGLTTGVLAGTATTTGGWSVYLPLIQGGCAPVELIQDGGFEAGLISPPIWRTSSNVSSDILDDLPNPGPHSGTWKAWMGGDNLVQESLWQAITVPPGVAGLELSYWWRVDTLETSHPFDTLVAQIWDAGSSPLQTLETLTDGDASPAWQQSTFTVTGYAGQTIQVAFVAQTDDTRPTSFFVDDVSVYKTCPAGLTADVTGDCRVSVVDIQETVAHWGESQGSGCYAKPYDQDGDGIIDATDFQSVAGQWRQTAP